MLRGIAEKGGKCWHAPEAEIKRKMIRFYETLKLIHRLEAAEEETQPKIVDDNWAKYFGRWNRHTMTSIKKGKQADPRGQINNQIMECTGRVELLGTTLTALIRKDCPGQII